MPQTSAPQQQQAAPGAFGQPAGALDGLAGLWLPAGIALLILLGIGEYLRGSKRRRGATVWTEEVGWFSIPDTDAASRHLEAVGEPAVPAAEMPPELARAEPMAKVAGPTLMPSLAASAGPTNGAYVRAMRPPSSPARPARTRPPGAPRRTGPRSRPTIT